MKYRRKGCRLWTGILACATSYTFVVGFSTHRPSHRVLAQQRRTRWETDLYQTLPGFQDDIEFDPNESSRRRTVLQGIVAATALGLPTAALAGKAELDSTGQLFTPKSEMLSGGSEAARGVSVTGSSRTRLQPGQALQSVYETRFIAYLSRFLLNFDSAAHAWWLKQGAGDTWEEVTRSDKVLVENTFAQFAESVEFGLSDYFVGPYGSYSSVSAARAGLFASNPAPSKQPLKRKGFLETMLMGEKKISDIKAPTDTTDVAKQGVLNLYALLKARYTSTAAKRQLAILFSFISSPKLQPAPEISALLGEADNATVSRIQVVKPAISGEEADSRTSSRRGGGYSIDSFPRVVVDPPPALGDDYPCATALPVMMPTTRILRIRVTDPGEGYTTAPTVRIIQSGIQRGCQAVAILDRSGRVETILVLDPGYGYGGRRAVAPKVTIDAPSTIKGTTGRQARAVADLEYEVVGVEMISGGSGYVKTEPPNVAISPPDEDPDWFLAIQELPEMRMIPVVDENTVKAQVEEMKFADGNIAFSLAGNPTETLVDDQLLDRLQRDPLELLPSYVRPRLTLKPRFPRPYYKIPVLDTIPQFVAVSSPRFRASDPVFGSIGKVPVTKGALELSASEYARLALSGAVCTVLVRTVLNPLELVKTKQQLLNDDELIDYVRTRHGKQDPPSSELQIQGAYSPITVSSNETSNVAVLVERQTDTAAAATEMDQKSPAPIGTVEMMRGMIELRGPWSLFQSADITFLASLVFGSFGFGATELFRRSFTQIFFAGEGSESGTFVLLLAASVATVITALAASPLEVLRVRSMCLIEPTKWTNVLRDYLSEKASNANNGLKTDGDVRTLRPRDVLPLWSGFAPTLSRELPFAIAKFLTFDLIANALVNFINSQAGEGALPIQVGVGVVGLTVSAASGALAGIAGAIVSHPADLILTKTSARRRTSSSTAGDVVVDKDNDWRAVVQDLTSQKGGIANLFVGLGARSTFFFLVIGLQFFLYDYVKTLFQVGSDDLSLVLDVFYAVRSGLVS